MVGQRPLEP